MKNGRFCAVNDRIYVDYFRKIEAQVVDFNWLMKNVLLPAVEEDKRIAEAKEKATAGAENEAETTANTANTATKDSTSTPKSKPAVKTKVSPKVAPIDNENERFTLGVSNPPYTKTPDGSTSTSSTSVYPLFIQTGMNTNQMSSVLTPARWMNSARASLKIARESLVDEGCHFRSFHHFTDRLFTSVDVNGGLSFYLHDRDYIGTTRMFLNNDLQRVGKLFDSTKIISTDEMGEIRGGLSDSVLQKVGKEMKRWLIIESDYFPEGRSTEAFIINSSPTRKSPTDIKKRISNQHGWRYFPDGALEEKYYTPEGKYAFAFKHASNNGPTSMNDYSLTGRESAKSTMAVIFDTPEQVRLFYRYARTKFFNRLVVGRLSSHNAMPQAYQDVPLFTFTETDGIDWDASIPELDKALIKHFGLEEHEAYFMAVEKPYARAFDDEMLAKLEAAGVDVTGINEWYEE